MGTKNKWFEDKQGAFAQLHKDVGANNVKVYSVSDYASMPQLPVLPPALLDKCSHVEVAVSGEVPSGRDWMVIAPHRVDEDSGCKVHDVDPILAVLESDTGVPSPSGVVALHQGFPGRTTDIDGIDCGNLDQTVGELRRTLETGVAPLENGSQATLNALAHMYTKFNDQFGTGDSADVKPVTEKKPGEE